LILGVNKWNKKWNFYYVDYRAELILLYSVNFNAHFM